MVGAAVFVSGAAAAAPAVAIAGWGTAVVGIVGAALEDSASDCSIAPPSSTAMSVGPVTRDESTLVVMVPASAVAEMLRSRYGHMTNVERAIDGVLNSNPFERTLTHVSVSANGECQRDVVHVESTRDASEQVTLTLRQTTTRCAVSCRRTDGTLRGFEGDEEARVRAQIEA